jgi:hypothetical protein
MRCDPNPERPGEGGIGTVIDPVPVTGLAANFSPIQRIAPLPLRKEFENMDQDVLSFAASFPPAPFGLLVGPFISAIAYTRSSRLSGSLE